MEQSRTLPSSTLAYATTALPPKRSWIERGRKSVRRLLDFRASDTPETERKNKTLRRITLAILVVITLTVAAMILVHPLATNDGPVHLAFSHLMLTIHEPGHAMQQQAYTVQLHLNPNLAVYLLMMALMHFFSPGFVESLVQVLCITGPVAAGYFALRKIQRKNAWLAIFLLPMSLNQTLFFGLYNHTLSTAAFFLALGTYYWMTKAPSYARAFLLSGTLVLTFFCHASGFIMATAGIGTMSATAAILSFWRSRNAFKAVIEQRYALVAMLAPLPLAALFLISGDKTVTEYGIPVLRRIRQFAVLHVLSIQYPMLDRFVALILSLTLLSAFAIVAARILIRRQTVATRHRDQAIGTVAASIVAFAIMMAFPDRMGGGWTHFRRFEVFPYFFMLLTLAFDNYSTRVMSRIAALATLVTLYFVGAMTMRQATVRAQMAPLADVDRLVRNHCTVLPVALEYAPEMFAAIDWMDYQPYFQSASRLELNGDRVVLFNYLARLAPYPVHFRPEFEPQMHIFHWKPTQSATEIEMVDVAGLEKASDMKVDYILVWGTPARSTRSMQQQVRNALVHFSPIYESTDGRVMLYQRQDVHNTYCEANGGQPS